MGFSGKLAQLCGGATVLPVAARSLSQVTAYGRELFFKQSMIFSRLKI